MNRRPGRNEWAGRTTWPGSRPTAFALLICVLWLGAGCNVVRLVAQAFPQKTPATYKLADRPTLVLVDDPQRLFDEPTAVRRIAFGINEQLQREKVLQSVVPQEQLASLKVTMADDFAKLGVDQIGRSLKARQVIHVHIVSVKLFTQPGLLEPTGVVDVKVIDTAARKRLFPAPPGIPAARRPADDSTVEQSAPDFSILPGGHRVTSQLLSRGADSPDRAANRLMERRLADRIARDVARLFHDYLPRQPGEPFE